jgi:RHS repeat-associated protein
MTKTEGSNTTTYSYDYENRLVSASNATTAAAYGYDPFGKRLAKTVNGTTTYYLYDNEDIIAEYDGGGALKASYLHGQGIDEPISMTRGSNTYFYTFDGLGSVNELTDSSGSVAESYAYDAFGNLQTPPTTGNVYTYTGSEYDLETGLYYYRSRYYDPTIGRFITKDLLSGELKNPSSFNAYLYVSNNPINFVDPFGRQEKSGKGNPHEALKTAIEILQSVVYHALPEGGSQLFELAVSLPCGLMAVLALKANAIYYELLLQQPRKCGDSNFEKSFKSAEYAAAKIRSMFHEACPGGAH